ncbi:hypothetical protein FHG87_021089 [Trinorchestia longiramus]|nr:hypothetical protein FHG87_021089 [Trinorchestia longiramus]
MASLTTTLFLLLALQAAQSCRYFCKNPQTNTYQCCDSGTSLGPTTTFNPGNDGSNPEGNGSNPEEDGSNPGNDGSNPGNDGSNPKGDGSNTEGDGSNPRGEGSNPEGNGSDTDGDGSNPEDDGSETDVDSEGEIHKVIVTEHGPEDGAKYNKSSGCVYYCAYGGSVYCCDDGSLTSESQKQKLDSPDIPPDDLKPPKLQKRNYAQIKKKAYKSVQTLKKSREFASVDRAETKFQRSKREAEIDAFPVVEASERSSRSRKTGKNSAVRRNYQGMPPLSPLSPFSNPLLSPFPFPKAEESQFGIEKITVNMSSLPILPAKIPPFHRAPLHPPFLPPPVGPNSLPHMPRNSEFLQPNPFRYRAFDHFNNPFGLVNSKGTGEGLDVGVIPALSNYSRTFPGHPGGNLINGPLLGPFSSGPIGPSPFNPAPFGLGPFSSAPLGPSPFGPPYSPDPFSVSSFGSRLDFSHMPPTPFSPLQSHLLGFNDNQTIEKSFSTHSIQTPTSSLFSPFSFSENFASPQSGIVLVDNSITKAISPQLQPPESSLSFRQHPAIPTQSFSSLNSLTSSGTHLPSISSGFSPFGSSVSFGSTFPSFSTGLSSFSSSPGLKFPPSTSSSGLSFQNGLVHPIHEIHPLLRSSFKPTSPIISNKHNFGTFHSSSSTPSKFNTPEPLNLHNAQSRTHSVGNTHFKTSGFSSQLKGETVFSHPPPLTSLSTGDISHPSPVRPPSADGGFRTHTQVITHQGPSSHNDGSTGRHVRDHSDHGHHNHIHHDHHNSIQHNHHQHGLHHVHQTPVHHGHTSHIQHNHSPGHSTRTESFSYIDAEGNHHIHFRGPPSSLPQPSQPSPPLLQPPLFSSSSIPSHHPPHPPPLSTHIRPPSAVLPLEQHHSTPQLPAHPPLNLLPPAPPRLNREINPVPVLPFEPSTSSINPNESSSTEIVLNIGEVRSRYKNIQEITLNIGESMPAISDIEINEHDTGRKTLTVNLPTKKSDDKVEIPLPQIEVVENLESNETFVDTNEKRDISVTTEVVPKSSAHKRPLSFPEDIPFFEKDNFDPVLIGDQIIKETDAPKFVRDAGFAPFRSESFSSSTGSDFPLFPTGKTSNQPPLYYPKSQVAPRPRIPALQGSTMEAFKKFMNEKNLDFALNDLFGEAPTPVQSQLPVFESPVPEKENPFHLIEYAKPKSVAEQIVLLEKICPCLARPSAFRDQEYCRCPAADRVAVAYRRTKREPYIVMTYKHFLIDRLALELEANLKSQSGGTKPRFQRPLKSTVPPSTDWTPILVPGSTGFDHRDDRHIEDLFLISIPLSNSGGGQLQDGSHSSLDAKGLFAIKTAIEEFVKTVEGEDIDYV